MDVELMALGFLMSGPKTGYRLKTISSKMMMFYSITLNQIYPTLRKLEKAGRIAKEVVFQTGKPNKNVYRLTEAGRVYFKEKISAPPVPVDISVPFLTRAFFFRFLDGKDIHREFEKEIEALDEQLDDIGNAEPTVASEADAYGRFIYNTAELLLQTLRRAYADELNKIGEKEKENGDSDL